ncbi:hypothetical protein KSP40_PGU006318 [Platanthera guangdongensis]|uniref:Vps16 N-terminal domain-containing protein n=1 Tax=Platanthera guangdongensis TaxID=2320717 RepID=A0ABR2LDI4_9ASPA
MASVSVAAEWQLLYNRYYRKPEIYSMQWGRMDLTRNRVACAPFGGPIAVIRDDSKIVQLFSESARRQLHIFNSAGVLLASCVWDRSGGRLVGMSWTEDHVLVCVVQDGTVYLYDVHAELCAAQFSMGKECFEQNVVECVFWGNGMICLTEGNQIFCVSDLKNPQPCKLADPALEDYPLCVAVIEPQYTMHGNVEVLLGVGDHVLAVEEDGVQQLGIGVGPLQKMALSPNGKYLAAFTHDGRLLVIPTDFSTIISDYSCESALPPEQIAWCGMDSVLLYWEDMLLMVGPNGDPVHYLYDEPIVLIPECDGVRILSNSSMEFLQRVPDSSVSIFQIGSTRPAALLYDALDHFDKHSAKREDGGRRTTVLLGGRGAVGEWLREGRGAADCWFAGRKMGGWRLVQQGLNEWTVVVGAGGGGGQGRLALPEGRVHGQIRTHLRNPIVDPNTPNMESRQLASNRHKTRHPLQTVVLKSKSSNESIKLCCKYPGVINICSMNVLEESGLRDASTLNSRVEDPVGS